MNKYAKNDPYTLTAHDLMTVDSTKQTILTELEYLENYILNLQIKEQSQKTSPEFKPVIAKEIKYRKAQVERLNKLLETRDFD